MKHAPAPERIIPQRVDTADILRSPLLIGCYGMRPVAQTKDFTCGAAAVATVLRYMGKVSNEYQCAAALRPSPVVGVTWWPIVKYLRQRGIKAVGWCHYDTDELIASAEDQRPTLVEWLDWGGHWVVHCGYDKATDTLVFADPAKPRSHFTCHSRKDFEKYWIAGGTGSMAYTPAMAVVIPRTIGGKKDYSYASDGPQDKNLLDWRTKRILCRKDEHAFA